MLTVEHLTVRLGGRTIVEEIGFTVEAGQWLMLVGPNGAGKSTVINAVTQGVPYTGRVLFEGADVARMKPAERARRIGVLAQNHPMAYGFTVEEIVRLGCYARRSGPFSRVDAQEERLAAEALRRTGLQDLRMRPVTTLSGGELQRTFLAQLFAQDPRLLILDEPANHLDLPFQREILESVREWLKEKDRAVISVMHDLSLARLYGTDALLLDQGRCAAQGPAEAALSEEPLSRVYRMDVGGWQRRLLELWEK